MKKYVIYGWTKHKLGWRFHISYTFSKFAGYKFPSLSPSFSGYELIFIRKELCEEEFNFFQIGMLYSAVPAKYKDR